MSSWLLPWLGTLPLRWIVSSLLAAGLFWAGYLQGQQGVQQAWDTELLQQKTAALKQSLQVAQVQTRQEQINQRITTDYDTRKIQLKRLWQPQKEAGISASDPLLSASSLATHQHSNTDCLHKPTSSAHAPGAVSTDAHPSTGVDAAATYAVSHPASAQIPVSCEQLASDAAQTTLMVLAFQSWYAEHVQLAGSR